MRPFVLFIVALNFAFQAYSQKTPSFLTTFYFEDAIGNRDSMEIGFDLTAKHRYNPDFGELLKQDAFDSIFEVRAINYFEYSGTLPTIDPLNLVVRRIVGGAEKYINLPCIAGDFLIFFIHAIHQPITISVKSVKAFEKIDCPGHNSWDFLSPDGEFHLIDPWVWASTPGIRYGCINDSSYTFYLGEGLGSIYEKPYRLKYEIEGKGMDTIYGISLVMDQSFSRCDSNFVGTEDKSKLKAHEFFVYPNPITNSFLLNMSSSDQPVNGFVYNQTGILIKNYSWNEPNSKAEIQLDISELPMGIYFLKLQFDNGFSRVKKFVKN